MAWLSFEELDDDPIRFWDLVIAALRQCRPTLGETALALLHSPQSLPLSTVLTALLHDVERNTQDIILILDDYHVISDQAICDSMSFLLNHVPSTLHVVLVGRADPDLPLPRFRVRGQLFEIRDQDLRFTEAETAHFLRHATGLPLSEEEVATLSRRTEGWIAGLQLAALSLRKRPDHAAFVKDFAGNHRYLLDYVQQDILAPLPTPLQDFLLQTSIVPRMNAALCQAVTAGAGASESQEMLQALEQANLFLVPLDSERQWYRYHELFREALLARLHASQPQLVPLLHLRAARFYEAQHEWREAITHALTVPDHAYAASLMEQAAWPFWLRGEARTIHTWVFSLPDAILRARVHLALDAAFRFIDSVNLSTDTRHDSVVAQVENTFTRIEGPSEGYLYYCLFVVSYAWNRLEEASDWLAQLLRLAQDWQHMELLVVGETCAAQLGLARGDLSATEEALHRLEVLLEQSGFAHHVPWVNVVQVHLWLARGNLAEASAWAAQTTFSPESWNPLHRWELLMLVRVLLARQQYQQAVETLSRFSQYLDREGSIDTVLEFLALSVVSLHHAGNSAQAAHVAARLFAITEPEGHLRVYLDAGTPMRQALSALLADAHPGKDEAPAEDEPGSATVAIARPYVLRLLAAFEQEEQKKKNALHHSLAKTPHASSVPGRVASASPALVEPLTEREQEVLRLLTAGASNQQIAAALVIQLSTVKKHVSNLLAKLGAESRTQAIAQARAFSLL